MAEVDGFTALRDKRLRYVESARENDFEEGLRSLLAELYPDNAHFIYELLQNAEDARATYVEFELSETSLTVTHDGARTFSLDDIESITGIGKSTKKDDETQIGKFGVGFKAVFAYTTRPEIRSGNFSFAINDLFVPELMDGPARDARTVFSFPFDRAEKPFDVACAEVERGLRDLDEKTLLFLNNIREITYALPGGDIGFVKRVDVDDLTIRVETSQGEGFVDSTWLRLVGPASTPHSGEQPLTVAAAFKLEPKVSSSRKTVAKESSKDDAQMGIAPLPTGDVSIYFPAAKEESRLRFHIHAPFASTVARDSVRDTPENTQLVADIGRLIVSNLAGFRERGLVDEGLLATLPNTDDNLRAIYGQIRSAVVEAFNSEAVTPVRGRGGHGRARALVSSPSEFRSGLSEGDLRFLLELGGTEVEEEPRWIRDYDGRAGRFVRDLDTIDFGWNELSEALSRVEYFDEDDADDQEQLRTWHEWLTSKNDDEVLNLYELLGQDSSFELYASLDQIPLIRLRRGNESIHVKGPDTFLPTSPSDTVKSRVPVELAYFDSDEASKRSNNLRSFYGSAGVKRWDERARIDRRFDAYRSRNWPDIENNVVPQKHLDDMKAFVQFARSEPVGARGMFRSAEFVLVVEADGDLAWAQPDELYLDDPYRTTGLTALYADDTTKYPLPGFYLDIEGIDEFLVAQGASATIDIKPARVFNNPEFKREWSYHRRSDYTQTSDWCVADLEGIVETADPVLMKTLWETVVEAAGSKAVAIYQANRSAGRHVLNSQLHQQLTTLAWVLDRDGQMRRPRELTLDELHPSLRPPSADSLVHRLGFGADAAQQEAKEAAKPHHAEQLGIDVGDAELIKEAREAGIDVEAAIHELIAIQRSQEAFPDGASEDPERRAAIAALDASDSAVHQTELRLRSVVLAQSISAKDARAYLREQYTNAAGDMYCQACQEILPFKVKGEWYFEAMQFVGSRNRTHRQNALALCPLCAAKYAHKRETSDEALLQALAELSIETGQVGAELPVLLNGQVVRIRFSGKHAIDLRSVMSVAGEART